MTAEKSDSEQTVRAHRLYAEFEIVPSADVECPIDELEGEITNVNQQFIGGDCHTDTTLTGDESNASEHTGIVHSKTELDAMCHCPVFLEYDCIPQTTAFNSDHLIIETYLPDRERLTELIDALKTVTGGVSLRRLTRIDETDTEQSNSTTLELYNLTDKQREAATKAVAAGYYQTPREATIGELATDLGISKSAMSQRLNAVESKLAVTAFRWVRRGYSDSLSSGKDQKC